MENILLIVLQPFILDSGHGIIFFFLPMDFYCNTMGGHWEELDYLQSNGMQ